MSDTGFLQISVYGESIGTPIENATIRIMEPHIRWDSGVVRTDSSGKTPVFTLDTPPAEYSLYASNKKPYAEYDAEIVADGFVTTRIYRIQVLPGCKSLENVWLSYRKNNEIQAKSTFIDDHTLWGYFPPKILEDSVKELPDPSGFIVLPEPVIPEFIVVHLGAPDTQAENVWVPFKDYIKNVASCEIYSTWPTETLTANVIAIISFALNRVYTEWYRGKGYDFTITNNTAYDQAFSHGRNIFEEISVVVDNVFSTYLTKPNIQQPLFTQYCDGKRTLCPQGLRQWESKALGDQGYKAIDILKRYYGNDCYYKAADTVQGIPSSFGGVVLSGGAAGEKVRTIQHQLNAISNHYPLIKKGREDGNFGADTQEAVRTFQDIFDLPVTGTVDFATWYRISDIYVAIMKLAEL